MTESGNPVGAPDIAAMLLSLIAVIAAILLLAWVLKRFNVKLQSQGNMRTLGHLALGQKERLMVVQVGDEKLLLGVTPQQISLLKTLPEDFDVNEKKPNTTTTTMAKS